MATYNSRSAVSLSARILEKASSVPLSWLGQLTGTPLVVPYYHIVSDDYVPHVSPLYCFRNVRAFRADLEFLLRNFRPIDLEQVISVVTGEYEPNQPCFHLTFDDGFREVHDVVAPVLESYGISATFFLSTAFLDGGGLAHHNQLGLLLNHLDNFDSLPDTLNAELTKLLPPNGGTLRQRLLQLTYSQGATVTAIARLLEVNVPEYVAQQQPYLCAGQIRNMRERGFSFGAHSHDHPMYSDLSLGEQLRQTDTSVTLLQQRYKIPPTAFAFPHRDDGVGPEFFKTALAQGWFQVSFGTGGLVRHFSPRNIERFSMERTERAALPILQKQIARSLYHRGRVRQHVMA